jgi:hypothetical protein
LFVMQYPSNKESISLTVKGKICLTWKERNML